MSAADVAGPRRPNTRFSFGAQNNSSVVLYFHLLETDEGSNTPSAFILLKNVTTQRFSSFFAVAS